MARNEMVLYGRNSVWERLKANPQSIHKIFLQYNFKHPQIEDLIRANHLEKERVSEQQLAKIKPTKDLQGIAARIEPFNYAIFDDLLTQDSPRKLTLLFLDRINDPQNLGVMIRTAACLGGFALVIPQFNACEVTEAVLHVASGGENYVPVALVTNLAQAITRAKKSGFWIVGAVVDGQSKNISEISLPFPLGLVLGSEGAGIRYGVDKLLDIKAHIPMAGAGLSFNVAVACAICGYEIVKQRGKVEKDT